jgi:hypothetical protein
VLISNIMSQDIEGMVRKEASFNDYGLRFFLPPNMKSEYH